MAISDKEQAAQGKTVQVGLGMITKPTPNWIKNIFRGFSAASGIWGIVYLAKPAGLNIDFANDVNSWIVLGLPAMHYIIKLFGWDYKHD